MFKFRNYLQSAPAFDLSCQTLTELISLNTELISYLLDCEMIVG